MNKIVIAVLFLLSGIVFINAEEGEIQFGISFAAGGRYDEVRMCVASPAGYKGGPAFEFAGFTFEGKVNRYVGLGVYIPVARPVLFAIAFKTLQFLPEAVVSFHVPVNDKTDFVTDIGIGSSLHYGHDYTSGLNPGEELSPVFFAAGPRASLYAGVMYYIQSNIALKAGVRPYFEYLISDYLSGVVGGAEIDIQVRFLIPVKLK